MSNVVKFPHSVSRKPTSEIGTPEERLTLRETVIEELAAQTKPAIVGGIDYSLDNRRVSAGSLSATAKNGRIRTERREDWLSYNVQRGRRRNGQRDARRL